MTAPGDTRGPASDLAAAVRAAMDPARARLFVYSVCLAISFLLYLLAHGFGQGFAFWTIAALSLAGLGSGIVIADVAWQRRVFRAAVILAVTLAIVVPLGPRMWAHGSMAQAMTGSTTWPQILVTLFGSRVLAEAAELQFTEAWRNPFQARLAAPVQSVAAALALGAFFTLVFYQVGAHLAGRSASASGIVVSALFGDTVIHHAIVFLFFVVLAFVVDATLIYVKDRSAVLAVRARARGGIGSAELRRLLDGDLAPWSHTRALRYIRDALDAGRGAGAAAPSSALAGFHAASRRFIRGLIPFLPLLGFLGTVIGLSIALAELPHGLSSGQREGFDIGGSLAGLAVKFETTLLGLLGSMVASLALGVLEKSETELAAECSLLVEAALARDRGHAV
jgi:hypothetical protein